MATETNYGNEWHTDFEHVAALFTHLRMTWLLKHLPPRLAWSVYVGVNGFATIGLLGLLALVTGSPFVFPSLGPTAYLFFFSPLAEASSSRNAILRPRHRAHLRLRGLRGHVRLRANLRRSWGSPSSKSSGGSSCSFDYRYSDGALPSESSSRRRNDAHRGPRDHLSAERAYRHRDRRDPAYRTGLRHQSDRGDSLSYLANGIDMT